MMETKEKPSSVKMSTTMGKQARQMVKDMNKRLHEASQNGEPTAWAFPMGCYDEILVAMDIMSSSVESFAGTCGVKRVANTFMAEAAAEGFSQDICTYTSTVLGYSIVRGRDGDVSNAPDGGLPKPTMMLGQGNSVCAPRKKLFQSIQRYMDVPVFVNNAFMYPPIDVNVDEVAPHYIRLYVDELKSLIRFLEKTTGRKLDYDKLSACVAHAEETRNLLSQIHQLRKLTPSPMPSEDVMGVLVPALFMSGRPETVEFYQKLLAEVKERVAQKITVIPEEKYRLLFGPGLPPWYALNLFNYVETLGAVFVTESVYAIWDYAPVPEHITDPLERIAKRFYEERVFYHRQAQKNTGNFDVEKILHLVNEFKVDGIVANRAYSCRGVHAGVMHRLQALKEFTDIPSMILELDMVDTRTYNEEQLKRRLDDFIHLVASRK